ncbi:Maltose O-acetyltransferase [Sinobacterium norvegicum]|uniref:Maltose O-acetyltransferase n=1 Tax=Sinobacterium norvegicum TaxID=1641715 RepID=A0ABN8ENF8_9GAMM|nr:sugar O-acetyltransferase [Sinobacterium norvegicum]CAH0992745.1 Maltose O-acetyltransferase [Sinobacterium norvegicum]
MATEKQKMLSGEWYNPNDKKLQKLRLQAKHQCHRFGQLSPEANSERKAIIQQLLQVESRADIEPPFHCDYGFNIHLGKHFFANHHCTILDAAKVVVGQHCMFGPNVVITTVNHPLSAEQRRSGIEQAKAITIGDDVWLAANVTVTAGVTIGSGVVVGAGSVVLGDLPANTLCVGAPARVVKSLV